MDLCWDSNETPTESGGNLGAARRREKDKPEKRNGTEPGNRSPILKRKKEQKKKWSRTDATIPTIIQKKE